MNDRKKALAICLIILVLAQFILFVVYFTEERRLYTSSATSSDFTLGFNGFLAAMALGACVDAVLALSIVVLLHRRRSKTPFSRTSSMVDRIMMYAVGSGLLTAAFALAALVTALTLPDHMVYFALLEMLPKRESTR